MAHLVFFILVVFFGFDLVREEACWASICPIPPLRLVKGSTSRVSDSWRDQHEFIFGNNAVLGVRLVLDAKVVGECTVAVEPDDLVRQDGHWGIQLNLDRVIPGRTAHLVPHCLPPDLTYAISVCSPVSSKSRHFILMFNFPCPISSKYPYSSQHSCHPNTPHSYLMMTFRCDIKITPLKE